MARGTAQAFEPQRHMHAYAMQLVCNCCWLWLAVSIVLASEAKAWVCSEVMADRRPAGSYCCHRGGSSNNSCAVIADRLGPAEHIWPSRPFMRMHAWMSHVYAAMLAGAADAGCCVARVCLLC